MNGKNRMNMRSAVALLCALLLCTLPMLALAGEVTELAGPVAEIAQAVAGDGQDLLGSGVKPGEALATRVFRAMQNNRRVESTMRFELGDEAQALLPTEIADAIADALKVTQLRASFAYDDQGGEVGFWIDVADESALEGKLHFREDGITLETSILPQKVMHISYSDIEQLIADQPLASLFDEETLQVLGASAQKYAMVIMQWGMSTGSSNMETIENAVPATDERDAAASQEIIRLTGQQYKDLYVALVDAFAADTELQQLLIKLTGTTQEDLDAGVAEAKEALDELKPTADGALVMTASLSEAGDLVGFDGEMGALFEGMETDLNIRYDYSSKGPGKAHAFKYGFGIGEENAEFAFRYVYDDSQPQVLTEETTAQMKVGGASSATSVNQCKYEIIGATETVEGEVVTTSGQDDRIAELLEQEDLSEETRALLADVKIGQQEVRMPYAGSVTALAGDDFTAAYDAKIIVDGGEMGQVFYTLSSSAYQPADFSGKDVVEVIKMEPENWESLSQEVQTGATQAMMAALGRMPASVLTLFMSEQ